MAKLTKGRVKDAKHPGGKKGKHLIPDSEVPGFGLLIHPSGVKSCVVRTPTPSGGRKLVTIGPATMDGGAARPAAGEIKRVPRIPGRLCCGEARCRPGA